MWPKQSEKTKRNHITVMSPIEAKFCIIIAITDVGRNCEGGQSHKNNDNGCRRVMAPLTSPA